MLERELQEAVIEMASFFGWLVAHFRSVETKRRGWQTPVAADGVGFPDLVLVRDRILFAELKVGSNKLSYEQEMWRDAIILAGGEWHQWREQEWTSGLIERLLK